MCYIGANLFLACEIQDPELTVSIYWAIGTCTLYFNKPLLFPIKRQCCKSDGGPRLSVYWIEIMFFPWIILQCIHKMWACNKLVATLGLVSCMYLQCKPFSVTIPWFSSHKLPFLTCQILWKLNKHMLKCFRRWPNFCKILDLVYRHILIVMVIEHKSYLMDEWKCALHVYFILVEQHVDSCCTLGIGEKWIIRSSSTVNMRAQSDI